jgi:hypothetical protein
MSQNAAVAAPRPVDAVVTRDQEHRAKAMRAILISSAGLTLTSLFELAVALVTGSVALLSDSLHNLGDVFTTVGIYFGFRMSRREATTRFPYGFGRAEDLAGVIVLVAIWISAVIAFYQSYEKLASGSPTTELTFGMVGRSVQVACRPRDQQLTPDRGREALLDRLSGFCRGPCRPDRCRARLPVGGSSGRLRHRSAHRSHRA